MIQLPSDCLVYFCADYLTFFDDVSAKCPNITRIASASISGRLKPNCYQDLLFQWTCQNPVIIWHGSSHACG